MRLAFVTHGSARVGMGHLRRCMTLAAAAAEQGAEPVFVLGPDSRAEQMTRERGFEAVALPAQTPDAIDGALARLAPGVVVADSYELGTAHLAAMSTRAPTGVIDDLADRDLPVALVWNGGIQATASMYDGRVVPRTRLILGPAYALLAPEYRGLPAREVRPTVERVLVTVGGADPVDALPGLLRATQAALPGAHLELVLGPFVSQPPDAAEGPGVTVHRAPPSLCDIMRRVDLAVSAGGQTTYELAATGTPAVVIWNADNQVPQTLAFERRGTLLCGGDVREGAATERVRALVLALAADADARRAMSAAGPRLLDGEGAARTATALLELC